MAARRNGASGAENRLGVTVSRRVGKAVVRNQVKRRIREWFRRHRQQWPMGWDVVVIARREARELAYADLASELERVAERAVGGGAC